MTCIMRFKRRYISISMCHMVTFWPKNFNLRTVSLGLRSFFVSGRHNVSRTLQGVSGGAIKTELLAQVGFERERFYKMTYFRFRSNGNSQIFHHIL